MSLKVNLISATRSVRSAKEMVQANLEQRRGRGIGRYVPANAGRMLVGAHDHGHGVPANQALDPPLDLAAAGIRGLLIGRDGVDVGRVGRERDGHALAIGVELELGKQVAGALRPTVDQHAVQGVQPLLGLGNVTIPIGSIGAHDQFRRHDRSPFVRCLPRQAVPLLHFYFTAIGKADTARVIRTQEVKASKRRSCRK